MRIKAMPDLRKLPLANEAEFLRMLRSIPPHRATTSEFPTTVNTNTGSIANTIVLKGDLARYAGEAVAGGAVSPGHLLQLNSSGQVVVNATPGGYGMRLFAKENSLWGWTINNDYASGDLVAFHAAQPEDEIQALCPASASAIVIGNLVVSNGDGTLVLSGTQLGGTPLGTGNLANIVASSSVITNTTAATNFSTNYTIPANLLQAGDTIRIRCAFSIPSHNSTDTLIVTLKIGSTTLVTVPATSTYQPAASDEIYMDVTLVVRTIGSSGTMVAIGEFNFGVPGTSTSRVAAVASTTINTTTTQLIQAAATWSAASTADQIQQDILIVDLDRTPGLSPVGVAIAAVNNSGGSSPAFLPIRVL